MRQKIPKNNLSREFFETPDGRSQHLGGGAIYWWYLGERFSLGYRQGVRVNSWYARKGWKKNKGISVRFAEPDDNTECDGVVVLSFEQAITKAKELCKQIEANPVAFKAPLRKYAKLPIPPPTPPYLVVHALMDFHRRQIALGRDIKPDESIMRNKIVPYLGHIELTKLKTKDIRDWLELLLHTPPRLPSRRPSHAHFARLTKDAVSKDRRIGAANGSLRVLKTALNLAFANEHCDTDAAWRRVIKFKRRPRKPPRYLERSEINKLVAACESDLRRLIIAALLSGCRANELTKLKVGDYRRSLRRIVVTDDKTGKTRHVTLSREGREYFDKITDGRSSDEFMLLRENGNTWGRHGYLYRLHRACNRVGISPVVGLHDLRRTFASHAVMAGIPLTVVSKQLGHARLSTTERSYMHLSVTYIDDIFAEKMPDLITDDDLWHLNLE